jgi:putative hydrolase of the HAD superfamily
MRYKAALFDLGGTLTYPFYWSEYAEVRKKIADVLSASEEDVTRVWNEDGHKLGTGIIRTYPDFIRHICDQLGLDVQNSQINEAVDIAFEMTREKVMTPRDGAIELLSHLKTNGYKTAIISDCAPDVPALWKETPFAPFFDITVFSCFVGLVKADTRIFELAIEKLGVEPDGCVYVADGMRKELTSASELGIHAIQIRLQSEIDDNPLYEDWNGQKVSSLTEIISLLN